MSPRHWVVLFIDRHRNVDTRLDTALASCPSPLLLPGFPTNRSFSGMGLRLFMALSWHLSPLRVQHAAADLTTRPTTVSAAAIRVAQLPTL